VSPFPRENLLVLINPHVSTKLRDRVKYAIKIAEYINQTAKLQAGNYLIFFPSFEFLELVWPFIRIDQFKKIKQPVRSTEQERDTILSTLKSGENYLLCAVMGGVFSEGIDYPGNMAIGAYIVSPGIPPFNFYRELQRYYFENEYDMGEEYAYIYPGMNKVIQAAGRIIRTEKDRGIIFLIGSRFQEKRFEEVFPEEWFSDSNVLSPKNPTKLIKNFWMNK
jgi:DNA excision repair protein ERCC-2